MSKERTRIYIDDVTGNQIASPADARNGGSRQLQGVDADAWLKANPDRAIKDDGKAEAKEASKGEDKAVRKAETK